MLLAKRTQFSAANSTSPESKSFAALRGGEGFRMRWVVPLLSRAGMESRVPHLTPTLSTPRGREGEDVVAPKALPPQRPHQSQPRTRGLRMPAPGDAAGE